MRFEAWSCTLCFSNCLAGTIFKKFVKYSQQNFGPTPCPKPSPNPCRFLAACNPPIPHSPGSFHSPPGSKFPPGFPCRSEQRFESTSQAWLRRFWGIEGKNGRNWWRKRYESLAKTWEKMNAYYYHQTLHERQVSGRDLEIWLCRHCLESVTACECISYAS